MKKNLQILIFFLLLEWQVFCGGGGYCLVTMAGLLALSVYQLIIRRNEGIFAKDAKSGSMHSPVKNAVAGAYALAILAIILLGQTDGMRYALIMGTAVLIIGAVSIAASFMRKVKGGSGAITERDITGHGLYHISVVFLYVTSFYLGSQIAGSIAYQSVILVSCLIMYRLERKLDPAVYAIAGRGKDKGAYAREQLNGPVKYWIFFLGAWSIMSMYMHGAFSVGIEHFLLFAFSGVMYCIYLHNLKALNPASMAVSLFVAAFIAGLSPVMDVIGQNSIPHYIQALIILVAIDAGNLYYRDRIGQSGLIVMPFRKKIAVYLLAGLYIMQLHLLMNNHELDVRNIYASVMGGGAGYASILDANGTANDPGLRVPDPQNAFRVRVE